MSSWVDDWGQSVDFTEEAEILQRASDVLLNFSARTTVTIAPRPAYLISHILRKHADAVKHNGVRPDEHMMDLAKYILGER